MKILEGSNLDSSLQEESCLSLTISIYGFNVALAILFVAIGAPLSISYTLEYGDGNRFYAVLVGWLWVLIAFQIIRFFRIWALRMEIHRKEFFLQHMSLTDPDRQKFVRLRNEAEEKLNRL